MDLHLVMSFYSITFSIITFGYYCIQIHMLITLAKSGMSPLSIPTFWIQIQKQSNCVCLHNL